MESRERRKRHAAIEFMKKSRPKLLITDIQMPGQDGLALTAYSVKSYPEVPVVILTGHGSEQTGALIVFDSGLPTMFARRTLKRNCFSALPSFCMMRKCWWSRIYPRNRIRKRRRVPTRVSLRETGDKNRKANTSSGNGAIMSSARHPPRRKNASFPNNDYVSCAGRSNDLINGPLLPTSVSIKEKVIDMRSQMLFT